MELAIPVLLLGGLYIVSNNNNNNNLKKQYPVTQLQEKNTKTSKTYSNKENFTNMGKKNNQLPNEITNVRNYPTTNDKDLENNVNHYSNPNSSTDKYFNQNMYQNANNEGIQVGQNIQNIYSLSGNYLNSNEFKHNNMKPFYGAKIKGQIYNNNNAETILDNMVGSGSQVIKKIEQSPLFKPEDSVQFPYGTPNNSDFYQSRVVPAGRNNSVKPFESVRVGPGINKGFTNEGSNGFNSGMEARDLWIDKTVDELRIKTNPKQEYSQIGFEGPAQSYVKELGSIGKVEKYSPDSFFINTQDRWLTTTGAEKLGQLVPNFIVNESNRNQTSTSYQGVASAAHKNASYNNGVYESSKKQQLPIKDIPISTAIGRAPLEQQNNLSCYENLNNSRSCNNQPDTFRSSFSSTIGAITSPLFDILRPTKKEEICNGVTIYGNAITSNSNNYVINIKNTPKITNKETTIFTPHGNVGNQVDNPYINTNTPISNQRDTTTCPGNWGGVGGISNNFGAMNEEAYKNQINNDKKESMPWTNQGNMNLFNNDVYYNLQRKDECNESTNRLQAPKNIINVPPSVETYGKVRVPQYYNQCIGCERINPEILQAFRNNPYTFSLTNTA
jgi:hypothetical protein